MVDDEFYSTLRDIAFSGYGLFFISHSKDKIMKDLKGNEYTQIYPSLADRPFNIINKMVDIITYIGQEVEYIDEKPVSKRYLHFRGTDQFYAGSRFHWIVSKVELSYDNLINAIYDAIDKEVAEKGGEATNDSNQYLTRNFDELIEDAKLIWSKATTLKKNNEVLEILANEFGKPTKFSEITQDQADILAAALFKIKEIL